MVVTDFVRKIGCKQALAISSLLLLLALPGCKPVAPAAGGAPPPPQVTVGHPEARDITDYDEFPARLSAIDSVEIRARVNGYLEKVNFNDGAAVKKGDVLFVIDPRPYQAEVDRTQAELGRAQSQLDLAENDFKRATELFETKAISAEELDTRTKGKTGAAAAVKSAQANLETAQLNLAYTSILAPIPGRVGRAMVREGNLVTGDGKDSTMLTTLVSIDPIYAYIDVDEATVLKYQDLDRKGLRKANGGVIPIDLALGNSDTFAYPGEIDFMDNQVDSATGTLHVRGRFDNKAHDLIPGEYGRMRVTASQKYKGMLIPDYAISTDQEKKIVYVVGDDKKIASKEVVPGQLIDGRRVIRSGLEATDWVVLDRLQVIRPGMTVTTKEAPAENTASITPPAHP